MTHGWRFDGLAFVLRSAYCFIRNFAATSVSLIVLSGRVGLMLLLNSAVADGTPVEL